MTRIVREVLGPRRRARRSARWVAIAIAVFELGNYAYRDGRTTSKQELSCRQIDWLAQDAFPRWHATHDGCPHSLDDLVGGAPVHDLWGHPYYWSCGPQVVPRRGPGIWIRSAGADGRFGTDDDVVMPR
jgi:hypothetical protein